MKRLSCGDCHYYYPETFLEDDTTIGRCLCHGYYVKSGEELCVDFER